MQFSVRDLLLLTFQVATVLAFLVGNGCRDALIVGIVCGIAGVIWATIRYTKEKAPRDLAAPVLLSMLLVSACWLLTQ
jgi:hypothetical protein